MNKPLLSQFTGKGWTASDGKTYAVQCLPIKELWASVPQTITLHNKPFFETLKADIAADGLVFPLLAVHATRKKIIEAKHKHGKSLSKLPFDIRTRELDIRHWVIWGGSQRLRVARELEYTHIDCAIIPSLGTAHRLQKDMRTPFRNRYYSSHKITEENRVKRV